MNKELNKQKPNLPDRIDQVLQKIGHFFMWSNVVLIALILLAVFMRYALKLRTIEVGELQWHFYAVGFMIGISYAVTTDSHMGMDLVRDKLSRKTQLWLDIFGIVILLLPFACIIFYQSLEFVHDSWIVNERSNNDMGLPFRWAIKSIIPISFGLLIISALSRLMRDFSLLGGKDVNNGS
jgi:TRAP-type mannitol/chloroaromatic compound transport system permease small subunit